MPNTKLTISKWPSKQAALKAVLFDLVVLFTLAPLLTKYLTILRCPAYFIMNEND